MQVEEVKPILHVHYKLLWIKALNHDFKCNAQGKMGKGGRNEEEEEVDVKKKGEKWGSAL